MSIDVTSTNGNTTITIKSNTDKLPLTNQDHIDILHAVGVTLESSAKQRFSNKQAPDGTSWKPSQKNKNTLIKTTTLMRSIVSVASADEVEVGSGINYSIFHQDGTKHLPKRQYLGVSKDDEADIQEIIADIVSRA